MKTSVAECTALTSEQVTQWLMRYLSEKLEADAESIDVDATFAELGVDSMIAIVMSGDLSHWSGRDIDPTALYEHQSITALAKHVSSLSV